MSSAPKAFNLSPELHQYLLAHGTPPDEIQQDLMAATEALGGIAIMQIAPEQGALMELLTRIMGARRARTFTGYSALCVARALPEDGQLICCDVSEEWTAVAQPFWQRAGVSERIDLRIAPALETLSAIREDAAFDLAFVDADKPSYGAYLEELLRLVRPGGLILVDNVLWGGNVIREEADDANTVAIRAFNDAVAADPRVDCVMLPISDGLTFLRVR